MNIDTKILKYLETKFKNIAKRITYHNKIGFIPEMQGGSTGELCNVICHTNGLREEISRLSQQTEKGFDKSNTIIKVLRKHNRRTIYQYNKGH